jgi:hypothetical protein
VRCSRLSGSAYPNCCGAVNQRLKSLSSGKSARYVLWEPGAGGRLWRPGGRRVRCDGLALEEPQQSCKCFYTSTAMAIPDRLGYTGQSGHSSLQQVGIMAPQGLASTTALANADRHSGITRSWTACFPLVILTRDIPMASPTRVVPPRPTASASEAAQRRFACSVKCGEMT